MNNAEAARWNKIINRLGGQIATAQVQLTSLAVQLEELLQENAQLKEKLAADEKKEKGNGKLEASERPSDAPGTDQPEVAVAE